jgi:hypothetical protein
MVLTWHIMADPRRALLCRSGVPRGLSLAAEVAARMARGLLVGESIIFAKSSLPRGTTKTKRIVGKTRFHSTFSLDGNGRFATTRPGRFLNSRMLQNNESEKKKLKFF